MKCQQLQRPWEEGRRGNPKRHFVRGRTACVVEMGMWMDGYDGITILLLDL
jgi:hypothetical protein